MKILPRCRPTGLVPLTLALALGSALPAQTLTWKGHTWQVTNGGMAGVVPGSPNNVSIDANGYLHLKITNAGGSWSGAEVFSTDKMGFGTYQWQIEGPVDVIDRNVVVGLYPYGPAAGIGQSGNYEIDIEFARWGIADAPNGDFVVWPPSGSTHATDLWTIDLKGGTQSTSRFVWSKSKVDFAVLSGFQPTTSTAGLLHAWTFAPSNPTALIPQVAMPLGINLWCFGAPPSDGKNVEIVIRDFQFIPEGTTPTTYAIQASAGSGGSISPSGSVSVPQGGSQTFTFTPSAGYTIGAVTVDGVNRGVIPSYVFSNVQSAHTISVNFTPIPQFTLTASAGAGGSISPSGRVKVNQGSSQSFAITPASGYAIASVLVDGVNKGALSSYAFSNVQATHNIAASFSALPVSSNLAMGKTATSSSNETADLSPAKAVDGSTGTRWSSGYVDPSWIAVDLGASKTVDRVVLAWEAAYGKAYQIQVSNDNATWSTVATQSAGVGGTETISFPATSARYVRLLGTARATQWGYSLWEFEVYGSGTPTQYAIQASAGTGGTISPSGTVNVAAGSSRSFSITPAANYAINTVTVDGVNLGAITSYTFSNLQAPHTIAASFKGTSTLTNLAPGGTGYIWKSNTSAASNANRSASATINDGNLSNSVVVNPNGENGSALWQGAGVLWSSAKTLSSAKFVNGTDDGYGNGYLEAGCRLQFSTDGTTWTDSGWSLSPAYPFSSSALGQTFTFTGSAQSNVRAARIVGQTGGNSWSWAVSEVQFFGN